MSEDAIYKLDLEKAFGKKEGDLTYKNAIHGLDYVFNSGETGQVVSSGYQGREVAEMTLERAVRILNEHHEPRCQPWEIGKDGDGGLSVFSNDNYKKWLTEFEARAIAEKILREKLR